MGLTLGIFIGESFAELTLVDTETANKLDHQRWYLPRANLKSFLTKYIAEKSITSLDKVFVGHRFIEKLFSYRIGGSVAQIVTTGFEKVLLFEETSCADSVLWPQKPPPVSSQELVFSVNEKVNSFGQVETVLDNSLLEQISAKLKMMEIKRVCLHLHNATMNNQNLSLAKLFFETSGFDVFIPEIASPDLEFQAWRKNLIEAAISGTFLEIQEELRQVLSSVISTTEIYFLGSKLNWFQDQKNERIGSIVSLENLWIKLFPKILNTNDDVDIFHFGLENFSIIQNNVAPQEIVWGKLPVSCHKRKDFQIQPTQSLKLNDNNELVFDKKELSFEPGPVTMGRGVIPCVYDVLNFSETLASDMQEKLKRSLQALLKSSHKSISTSDALALLKKNILDFLAANVEFSRSEKSKQIVIYGFLADLLEVDLKKHNYFSKLSFVSEKKWPKSFLIATWGLQKTND